MLFFIVFPTWFRLKKLFTQPGLLAFSSSSEVGFVLRVRKMVRLADWLVLPKSSWVQLTTRCISMTAGCLVYKSQTQAAHNRPRSCLTQTVKSKSFRISVSHYGTRGGVTHTRNTAAGIVSCRLGWKTLHSPGGVYTKRAPNEC